mgnify:CR=1 FL=1
MSKQTSRGDDASIRNKLKLAFVFIRSQCEGVSFEKKFPLNKGVILIRTNYGHVASVGITQSGSLKCFIKDHSAYKWAIDEGFSIEQIDKKLWHQIYKEVSITNLCRIFNGAKVDNEE